MILNWEKYHDSKTDIAYELPYFTMQGYESQEDFFFRNNLAVNSTIFSCIEFAILNKLEQVPCFILDGFTLIVDKPSYNRKLEKCLEVFEELEMYEQCAQIMKLKSLL